MCDKNRSHSPTAEAHDDEGGHDHHVKHTPEEWAERLDAPDRDTWQNPEAVMAIMKIEPGQTVADVGAGTGYFLKHLSRAVGHSGRVLALDVEEDLVEYMKQRALRENLTNVESRLCPFDGPGLEPESVDRILIVNTWHHIKHRVAYAQKLARALRNDGALYVIDFTKQATVGPPVEARLESSRILSELEQAQMSAELLEEDLPQQYIIRAVAR